MFKPSFSSNVFMYNAKLCTMNMSSAWDTNHRLHEKSCPELDYCPSWAKKW